MDRNKYYGGASASITPLDDLYTMFNMGKAPGKMANSMVVYFNYRPSRNTSGGVSEKRKCILIHRIQWRHTNIWDSGL